MDMLLGMVAVGFVGWRLWTRMEAMRSTIAELKERVESLERWRTNSIPPLLTAPVTVKPAAPMATPAPKAPVPVTTKTPEALPLRPTAPTLDPPSFVPAPQPTPEPRAAVTSMATPEALHAPSSREALETRIGSRWMLYVGVIAIVVGVSYFEKLAIDNHWVSEATRVIQGGVMGLLLVAAGLGFVRRGYKGYGQILTGCGIAILYVSVYAAFNVYDLIGQIAAFGLMSAVTTLAAGLAHRQRSQGLALVAVGGGFATPFLMPASLDVVALFGYDTFLIAGTMWLARTRDWPALNVVSYGFTALTVLCWISLFYKPAEYLTTELFLTLFCGMFLAILYETAGHRHPLARAGRAVLWTAPVGYYMLSLAVLSTHSAALLVYLVLLALVGATVGSRAGSWARLGFLIAVVVPLLLWSDAHGTRSWLAGGLAAWAGIYLLNLAGLLEATVRRDRRLTTADIAQLHLTGLAAFAGAHLLIDPVRSSASAPLAAALALINGGLGVGLVKRVREEALHFAALAFTMLTIAIGQQFEGAWITGAWAAEGAIVAWLGLRERREWLRIGGLLLFLVAIGRLVGLQFSAPPVGQLWLLNRRAICGLFIVALTYGLAFAHDRDERSTTRRLETGIGLVLAKLLLLSVAVSESVAYWVLHGPPPFEPAGQIIGAALLAAGVVMWLGLRRQQEWIRAAGGGLLTVAVYSLFLVQQEMVPVGYVVVLNARAGAGLLAVATLYALAVVHRRLGSHVTQLSAQVAVLTTTAALMVLAVLTSEIDAFWAARGAAQAWSMARSGLQAMSWATVGAFLIWHGLSNQRTWVRAAGGTLLGVGLVRLLALQFLGAAPAYIVVANARVIASAEMIALLYGLAFLYRRAGDVVESQFAPATVLWTLANVVTLTLLTSEITAYWRVRDLRHVSATVAANSHFAREMMLSITWAVYATLLIVIGLKKRYAPIRYLAMAVFAVTIVKVFAIDLAELDRIYRVLSVCGLGLMLLVTSYLYQKANSEAQRV